MTLMEKFERDELAIDVIAEMMGYARRKLIEAKKGQDMELINSLEKELSMFYDERMKVYAGDEEVKEKCIREYAPILKQRFEEGESQ